MKNIEDREQMAVVEWAFFVRIPKSIARVGEYLIAIPNAGIRSARVGAKFKKMGMKPGVSDLFLAYPSFPCSGLWIEMKKPRREFNTPREAATAVTDNQQEWLDKMNARGYMAKVAYGADEAIAIIKNYLGIQL